MNPLYKQVVVVGASSCTAAEYDLAHSIGCALGELGKTLISGGRGGIMEAVSRGASEAGALVIGILPGDDESQANQWCEVVIPTGIGYARNLSNVLSGAVVIAIGGGSGTLSEIAYAWQHGRVIYGCTAVEGWGKQLAGKAVDHRRDDRVIPFADAEELKALLKQRG